MVSKKSAETIRLLKEENEELRARFAEAEETIRALGAGEVDAFVTYGPTGPRIFTLQEVENAYRVIVETMNEGAITTTLKGIVLFGNKALTRMLGVPLSSILGRPLKELVVEESQLQFAKMLAQCPSGTGRERILLRSAEGVSKAAYLSTALLPQEEDEPRICMVLTDLTELEAATDQLRDSLEREKILAASEARFQLFAEAVPNIVWTATPEGLAEYYNRRWAEYSGSPTETSHGAGWKATLHPEDIEATFSAWQQAVANGRPYQVEHRLRRADGEYRWHISRAIALRDEKGRISKWYGTATDIDEQKRSAEDLSKLTDQLTRSNQELKDFAYIASHDLQEPLRMITGFLDLLKRRYRGRLDQQADEFIDFAVSGATRMHNLIHDLLSYSQVGTREGTFETVDSNLIIEVALANLRGAIEESGATVEKGALPVVVGDESMLVQLFQNLIANALKFRGPRPPEIRIGAETRQEEWLFSVQDRGIGLEPRQAEQIFQVFQRLHPASKYQGTGIGLAICKKIVNRHGGRVWVVSMPEQGATFYFTLPRRQV